MIFHNPGGNVAWTGDETGSIEAGDNWQSYVLYDFFDAVISIQVIHHNLMQNILTTVKEVERVLKIGGYLFITVPILGPKPENPEDDWKLHQVEDGTFIPQSGPESGIPHHYFTEEELVEVFRNFKVLEMYKDITNHRCLLGIQKS